MGHISSILVPIDGSPASVTALSEAVLLAGDLGAEIEVVHVTPEALEGSTPSATAVPEEEAAEEMADDMEEAIASAERTLHERLRRREVTGDPIAKILEVAAEDDADLIVMGTHGRLGRIHALVGSVAEAIVRNAPCPVLTVRHGAVESFADKVHHREAISGQSSR
jgi:nucleotide-binding universal stress UspA family protein